MQILLEIEQSSKKEHFSNSAFVRVNTCPRIDFLRSSRMTSGSDVSKSSAALPFCSLLDTGSDITVNGRQKKEKEGRVGAHHWLRLTVLIYLPSGPRGT